MAKTTINLYFENGGPEDVFSINLGQNGVNSNTLNGTVKLTQFVNLTAFEGGSSGIESVIGLKDLNSLSEFSVLGDNTLNNDLSSFPDNLDTLDIRGQNKTSGDISDIPNNLGSYSNLGNNTTTGNIANLSNNLVVYRNAGNNTTFGDIGSLPNNIVFYDNAGNNTVTGNLSTLPSNMIYFRSLGNNTIDSYYNGTDGAGYGKRVWASNFRYLENAPTLLLGRPRMPESHLATLLVDLLSTTWAGERTIKMNENNPVLFYALYPEASSAIAELNANNVQVLINSVSAIPTFYRDFAKFKTLDHGGSLSGAPITFTRNSNATYFDENGVMQIAVPNTPRFDHSPVTGISKGLLVEETKSNFYSYSSNLDAPYWLRTSVGAPTETEATTTFTSGAAIAPDGTLTASLFHPLNISSLPRVRVLDETKVSLPANKTYTLSIFAKAAGYKYLLLDGFLAPGEVNAEIGTTNSPYWASLFDVESGTIILPTKTSFTAVPVGTKCEPVGNDWYRLSMSYTPSPTLGSSWNMWNRIMLLSEIPQEVLTSNYTTTTFRGPSGTWWDKPFTGSEDQGVYLWGAQLEEGPLPTSYIPTTNISATRIQDVAVVTSIAPFYNNTESTLFVKGNSYQPGTATFTISTVNIEVEPGILSAVEVPVYVNGVHRRIAELNDGVQAGANHITFGRPDSEGPFKNGARYNIGIPGSGSANLPNVYSDANDNYANLAISVKLNENYRYAAKGIALTDANIPTMPTVSQLSIGHGVSSSPPRYSNGHVNTIMYFPEFFSLNELEQITSY